MTCRQRCSVWTIAALAWCCVVVACSKFGSDDDEPAPLVVVDASEDADVDMSPSPVDAGQSPCSKDAPFRPPVRLADLNGDGHDAFARLTPDELTVIFHSNRADGGLFDLYSATRTSRDLPFGEPTRLAVVNTPEASEAFGSLSPDQRTLHFARLDPGGDWNLYQATRASSLYTFDTAKQLDFGAIGGADIDPFVTLEGDEFWWAIAPTGDIRGSQIVHVRLDQVTVTKTFVDAGANILGARAPVLSPDRRTLFFSRAATGSYDVFAMKRASSDVPFEAPEKLLALSSIGNDLPTWMSPDGCRLYVTRSNGGNDYDLYVAERETEDAGPPGVVSVSHDVKAPKPDVTSPVDGPITADGVIDAVFDVAIDGPVLAIGLLGVGADDAPNGAQWDTWTIPDVIPPGAGPKSGTSAGTWQLAIFEGGVLQNDASGRVSLGPGRHHLQIVASDGGHFVPGARFRVIAEGLQHEILSGDVVRY